MALDAIEESRVEKTVAIIKPDAVRMGGEVLLAADSFLMKGESPDPGTTWRGNPAKAIGCTARQSPLVEIVLPSAVAPTAQTAEPCQ